MSNPYSSPEADLTSASEGGDGVSSKAIDLLRRTRPWVRFMSVLIFIGGGFMLLAGIFMILGMGAAMLGAGGNSSGIQRAPLMGIGILYIILAIVYLFPGVKLWKYADSITRLMADSSSMSLEAALDQQRSFWKFVGIFTILFVVLYVLAIIGFFVFGAAASLIS